jgi:hypothetical protein
MELPHVIRVKQTFDEADIIKRAMTFDAGGNLEPFFA